MVSLVSAHFKNDNRITHVTSVIKNGKEKSYKKEREILTFFIPHGTERKQFNVRFIPLFVTFFNY